MKKLIGLGLFLALTNHVFAQRHQPGFGFRGLGTPPAHGFLNRFPGMIPRFRFIGNAQQTSFNFGIPPIGAIPPLGLNILGQDVITPGLNRFGMRHGFSNFGDFGFFGGLNILGQDVITPGLNRFGRRHGFSNFGDFGFFGGYPLLPVVTDEYGGYGGAPTIIMLQPIQMPVQPPQPPEVAHAAMHEYPQTAEAAHAGQQPVFTLAMNDGSRRAAILVWVQNGAIHYIDPSGRTEHAPLNSLDRPTTERLNQEKNLDLHLPERAG